MAAATRCSSPGNNGPKPFDEARKPRLNPGERPIGALSTLKRRVQGRGRISSTELDALISACNKDWKLVRPWFSKAIDPNMLDACPEPPAFALGDGRHAYSSVPKPEREDEIAWAKRYDVVRDVVVAAARSEEALRQQAIPKELSITLIASAMRGGAQVGPSFSRLFRTFQTYENAYIQFHLWILGGVLEDIHSSAPDYDDLIQHGVMGLIEGVRRYDVTKGYAFVTLAAINVRRAMHRAIRREGQLVRTKDSFDDNSRAVRRFDQRFGHNHPTACATLIAAALGIKESELHFIRAYGGRNVGPTIRTTDRSGNVAYFRLQDWVEAPQADEPEPERRERLDNLGPMLFEAMKYLNVMTRRVLFRHYFLGESYRVIGDELGASDSAVGARVKRALERMRYYPGLDKRLPQ